MSKRYIVIQSDGWQFNLVAERHTFDKAMREKGKAMADNIHHDIIVAEVIHHYKGDMG